MTEIISPLAADPADAVAYYRAHCPPKTERRVGRIMWEPILLEMIEDRLTHREAWGWAQAHYERLGFKLPGEKTLRDWLTQLRAELGKPLRRRKPKNTSIPETNSAPAPTTEPAPAPVPAPKETPATAPETNSKPRTTQAPAPVPAGEKRDPTEGQPVDQASRTALEKPRGIQLPELPPEAFIPAPPPPMVFPEMEPPDDPLPDRGALLEERRRKKAQKFSGVK